MSAFQWWVIARCFVINMLDGFDVLVMAFTASSVAADWGLSGLRPGYLLSAGLVGRWRACNQPPINGLRHIRKMLEVCIHQNQVDPLPCMASDAVVLRRTPHIERSSLCAERYPVGRREHF